ncbi:MAG: metal-dependent transcriptional regulator [Candidatus Methanomethylophilaceae archaeon]|nr:metal-dependent transcriptional regulator [Candidatus Methanomethylophilaceae archaeon]
MATANREDYILNILRITEGSGVAKTTELASYMNVSPASVSEMVKVLASEGLVTYEKYKGMSLTPAGLDYARQLRKKHHVLETFLTEYLNTDHETAHEEACKMEHTISDETAIRMCNMMGNRVDSDCQSCTSKCKAASEGVPQILPLNKLAINEVGKISHIQSDDSEIVKKLITMGFVPGRELHVDTIMSDGGPRIIKMGDASIALEYRMASCIFVDLVSDEEQAKA